MTYIIRHSDNEGVNKKGVFDQLSIDLKTTGVQLRFVVNVPLWAIVLGP